MQAVVIRKDVLGKDPVNTLKSKVELAGTRIQRDKLQALGFVNPPLNLCCSLGASRSQAVLTERGTKDYIT